MIDRSPTPDEIAFLLKDIKAGDVVIYYIGDLAKSYCLLGSNATAGLAWNLHENGRVYLFQRRRSQPINHLGQIDWRGGVGTGYEYIAIGRSRPSKTPNFRAHLNSVLEAV